MAEATLDFPPIDDSLFDGNPAPTPDDVRPEGVVKPYNPGVPAAEEAPKTMRELVVSQFNAMRPKMLALVQRFSGATFDLKTTKGLEAAKAARHALREEGRFLVQRAVEGTKKEARELNKLLDVEGAKLIGIVQPREDEIDTLIKAREAEIEAEKTREREAQQARLDKLTNAVALATDKAPEQIDNAIAHLKALVIGIEKWGTPANASEGDRERQRVIIELAKIRDEKVRLADLAKREAEIALRERELAAAAPVGWRPTFRPPVLPEIAPDTVAEESPEPEIPAIGRAILAADAREVERAIAADAPEQTTINAGEIARRLGFALSSGVIEDTLKVPRHGSKGASVLWRESQWADIKAALIAHIGSLA